MKSKFRALALALVTGFLFLASVGVSEAATPVAQIQEVTTATPDVAKSTIVGVSQDIIKSLKEKGTPDSAYKVAENDLDIVLDAVAFVSGPND